MNIGILATNEQKNELLVKSINEGTHLHFVKHVGEFADENMFDFFLLLKEPIDTHFIKKSLVNKPVFLHSVTDTLHDLQLPANCTRLNAWPGFINRQSWEIASSNFAKSSDILKVAGWDAVNVADQPGFIAARVIVMIINEAYFALQENVSTKADIDIAMKLGTSYPYGPFEWSKIIGLLNVTSLLKKMAKDNIAYTPCELLLSESLKS